MEMDVMQTDLARADVLRPCAFTGSGPGYWHPVTQRACADVIMLCLRSALDVRLLRRVPQQHAMRLRCVCLLQHQRAHNACTADDFPFARFVYAPDCHYNQCCLDRC